MVGGWLTPRYLGFRNYSEHLFSSGNADVFQRREFAMLHQVLDRRVAQASSRTGHSSESDDWPVSRRKDTG